MLREDLRIPLTMLSRNFLNKSKFKGSYNGKRFIFEKTSISIENETKKDILRVYLWKDVLNFESTPKEEIKIKDFDYSDDGISSGLDFVESEEV